MNNSNLNQIFTHYIDKFEYVNNGEHMEYYKWQVCHEYPILMKKALSADKENFADSLKDVKKCTYNIIDSYTQPFGGLVEIARHDPDAVRIVFKDLYAEDGNDIKIRMEKINDFFNHCNDLLNKYYPDSFLYKQNSHSVSSYLFLNDPDNHYMYKAVQSQRFADCVEFYDDWGSGDCIKLDVYHRMCDELVAAIKDCAELINTDQSRFDGRLRIDGELHPDRQKHILAFDLIYCCSTYDLYDGISYTKRNMKEKQLYLAEKAKAQQLLEEYEKAKSDYILLDEAVQCFIDMVCKGDKVIHKKYGEGCLESIDDKYISATYECGEVAVSLPLTIANDIIRLDKPDFNEKVGKYRAILKRYNNIPNALDYAARALKPYEEYIE